MSNKNFHHYSNMVLQTRVFGYLFGRNGYSVFSCMIFPTDNDIALIQNSQQGFSSLCFLLFVLYLMGEVCLPFPMIPWCNAEVIEALALRVSLKYAGTLTLFDLLQKQIYSDREIVPLGNIVTLSLCIHSQLF